MQASSNKIIVKVGKSSHLKFRRAVAFRAVTIDELNTLYKLNPDTSIVIIENIVGADDEKLKSFITKFESDRENNRVFFYLPDNDDTTSGVADELDKNIYLNARDLYDAIEKTYGLVVSTDISKAVAVEDFGMEDPFDPNFIDAIETIEQNKKIQNEQILPSIESKDDLSEFDTSILDKEDEKIAAAQKEQELLEKQSKGIAEDKQSDKSVEPKTEVQSASTTDINTSEASIQNGVDSEVVAQIKSELEASKKKANEYHNESETLRKELQAAIKKGSNLSNLIKALESEKEILSDKLSVFSNSEVMEEPIPLVEYQQLQAKLEQITKQADSSQALSLKLDEALNKLKNAEALNVENAKALEDYKKRIQESGSKLVEARKKVEEHETTIKSLQNQLETASKAERLSEETAQEIEKLKNSNASYIETIKNLKNDIEFLKSEKNNLLARIEKEVSARVLVMGIITDAVYQMNNTDISNASNETLIKSLKETVESLEILNRQNNSRIADYEQKMVTFSGVELTVRTLQATKDNLSAENESQRAKIKEYETKLASFATLDATVKALQAERDRLQTESSNQQAEILDLNTKLASFASSDVTIQTLQSEKDRLQLESSNQRAQILDLNTKLASFASVELSMQSLQSERDRLQTESSNQRAQITDLTTKLATEKAHSKELEGRVATVDVQLEIARNFSKSETDKERQEKEEIQSKYNILESQYKARSEQYEKLVASCGMNENGVNSLLETSRALEDYNKTLITQVATLKKQLEQASSESKIAKQTAEALEASNRAMRTNMESMSSLIGDGSGKVQGVKQIRYSGRGTIIPIFGYGSFGITTTAMSIAYKLGAQSRVLYIDFDMTSPKADAWFRQNPQLKGLPDTDQSSMQTTGLGVLINKGIQYFISNHQSIILKSSTSKNGCIDYLSGLYLNPDVNKLITTDYSALLNFLGNIYTYIVIDFGKLGCSEYGDQIIKTFIDAAPKSVIVATSDKIELRSFSFRLMDAKINMNKIAWLLNLCSTTKLDDFTKKVIGPAGYTMIPFNPGLYGKRMNFMTDGLTRDKMVKFIMDYLVKA